MFKFFLISVKENDKKPFGRPVILYLPVYLDVIDNNNSQQKRVEIVNLKFCAKNYHKYLLDD